MLERILVPGRSGLDDRHPPLAHSRRQVQQTRVAGQSQRAQLGQPGAHQQRHARGDREPGLARGLERGTVGRAAAEQDLPAPLTPVTGNSAVMVERPVLRQRAGEGLNQERGAIQGQFVGGKEAARLVQGLVRQHEFIAHRAGPHAALVQQREKPLDRVEAVVTREAVSVSPVPRRGMYAGPALRRTA